MTNLNLKRSLLLLVSVLALAGGASLRARSVDAMEDPEESSQWHRALQRTWYYIGWGWGPSYSSPTPAPTPMPSIVELAVGEPSLSRLVELVTAAGLVETLSGPGPFTVFAPTNDAFNALPADVTAALAADPALLTSTLLNHAVSGQRITTFSTPWRSFNMLVPTADNGSVRLRRYRAGRLGPMVYKVNDAKVVVANIYASNGIVHVIDAVL